MPPYLMGAPLPSGGERFLLDVDFSSFSLGFYDATTLHSQSYTAPTKSDLVLVRNYSGLTVGGAAGETVQTSETTLMQSALTTQTDIARIGRRKSTSLAGLVIQPGTSSHNNAASSAGNTTAGFCPGGTPPQSFTVSVDNVLTGGHNATVRSAVTDTPDTTGNVLAAGLGSTESTCFYQAGITPPNRNFGIGDQYTDTHASDWVLSSWGKNFSSAGYWMIGTGTATAQTGLTNTWTRLDAVVTGNGNGSICWNEGRVNLDMLGHDVYITYMNLIRGRVPLEIIPTYEGESRGDRLRYLTGSALVAVDGQIKFRARLSPLGASTDEIAYFPSSSNTGTTTYQAGQYLFSYGKNGHSGVWFNYADKKLYVKLENELQVSANTMTFNAHDLVEIFVAAGNNLPTVAKYRVDTTGTGSSFGVWQDLAVPTVVSAPNPGSNFIGCFYNDDVNTNGDGPIVGNADTGNGDTGNFAARVHRLSFYQSGGPPGV